MTEMTFKMSVDKVSTSVPMYRYVPLPPDGNIRQALVKRSNASYDFEWADVGGGDAAITLIAGETLSALKLVYEEDGILYVLSNTDDEDLIDCLAGLTLTAGGVGEPITVTRSGYVEDSGWSWEVGRIYLGTNGQLTQIPPSVGASLMVAKAVSATKIIVDFSEAVFI